MEGSILTDVKKMLGIVEADTSFDLDITTYINSTFGVLQQLGVGPTIGYVIEDKSDLWEDYIGESDTVYNMIRPYIYLKVRMLFDPPSTSFLITAMNEQIEQYEWRISTHREWSLDPNDPALVDAEEDEDE